MQVDTLRVQTQDTVVRNTIDTIVPAIETAVVQPENQIEETKSETTKPNISLVEKPKERVTSTETAQQDLTEADTTLIKPKVEEEYQAFNLFNNLTDQDSSVYKVSSLNAIKSELKDTSITKQIIVPRPDSSEKGWIFGLAIFSTLLFVIIRLYFSKYLTTVIASSVNFQMADKLVREKNILVRRVFILLNINFLIATSLYVYVIMNRVGVDIENISNFTLFLLILGVLFLILFVRLIILNIIAGLFDSRLLFREFIHNTYLLNKNLGLYLLPMVLSIFYLPNNYADLIFYSATILIILSLLYRYLRSLQIILKHKVLYFYTILYLCTLEILPALVGIKFVLSLR